MHCKEMICLNEDKKEIGFEPAEIENCAGGKHNLRKIPILLGILVIGAVITATSAFLMNIAADKVLPAVANAGSDPAASSGDVYRESAPPLEPKTGEASGDVKLDIVPRPDGEFQSLNVLYEKLAPSVAAIQSGSGSSAIALGTGIVISADGYILTCGHLLENTNSVTVLCADGMEYPATLAGIDAVSDLALLQIKAVGLIPAEFGSSLSSSAGEAVLSIGDPIGSVPILTTGILSAVVPDMRVNGLPTRLLLTNLGNTGGSSGAPVFNYYGQVIGVANSRLKVKDGSKLSALTAEMVTSIVSDLSEYGKVPGRPALNADIRDLQPGYSAFLGLPSGTYVVSAAKDSALKKDDIITAVDGFAVNSASDLNAYINGKSVGDSVTLTVVRGRDYVEITETLKER